MFETIRESTQEHPVRAAGLAAGTGLAGIGLLYRGLQPEKNHDGGGNYFDIIANLDECIRREAGEDVEYLMLGGGAAAALTDPNTQIDVENHRIIPPSDITKSQYREDNGTKADVDILVLSTDEEVVDSVRNALTPREKGKYDGNEEERGLARELDKPGARLKIGVTGLMPGSEYHDQPANPLGKAIKLFKKDWVSQRLQYHSDVRSVAISDVEVQLPQDYFEPWQMVLKNDETVAVPHPLIQVLCYLSRASHGVREQRDGEKVDKMMHNIGPVFGAHLIWGDKRQTARMVIATPPGPGVRAAADFVDQKNKLRFEYTKERMSKLEAGVLAAKIAIHRRLDTWKFVRALGQDGWLYDNIIARFSGERQ
ncbi:MAG TPA: hypothetical protein VFX86_04795 [Candidatus Saccharimonadales bacterium]|nr:hypothetical protein [Candidatus Saccharimonadales bacterium]